MKLTHQDEEAIIAACKILSRESIGDFIYQIRERLRDAEIPEGKSTWESQRLKDYGQACVIVDEIVKKYGQES